MAFFVSDVIDVGVEILSMKELQEQMSSGPQYYQTALYDLIRQGRSTPAVPMAWRVWQNRNPSLSTAAARLGVRLLNQKPPWYC